MVFLFICLSAHLTKNEQHTDRQREREIERGMGKVERERETKRAGRLWTDRQTVEKG